MDQKNANDIPNFGEAIKYYRVLAKMTQEQLADNICAREYIGKVEKGKQVPTLFIVNAMSEKLGINLFDAFALMMEHNDFDTHQKIEALNDAIASRDAKKAYELASTYASLPGFGCGAPLQYLKYVFSLYYSNELHDFEKSIQYAKEGLTVSDHVDPNEPPTSHLSVSDMVLLLTLSVSLCRCKRLDEGKKYFKYLHDCTALRCRENRYIANRNRRFDINMYALTTFNLCEFFPDDVEENLALLNDSIGLLEEFKSTEKQSELLIYKSKYLYASGRTQDAKIAFNAGYYTYILRHSEEEAIKFSKRILEERFDILKSL